MRLLFFIEGFFMVEITRLFWKRAFTSDNKVLGEVESAELDMSNWKIINLYVALTDEAIKAFGFKHPYLGKVIVCLPVEEVETIKDTVVLNKTMEQLRDLKQCRE
jgi:sporulation protein YlmC with PRC-barrel domain